MPPSTNRPPRNLDFEEEDDDALLLPLLPFMLLLSLMWGLLLPLPLPLPPAMAALLAFALSPPQRDGRSDIRVLDPQTNGSVRGSTRTVEEDAVGICFRLK